MDRIDYNIECAHKETKQAVVHLEKTVEIEKSARAKVVMACLLASIILCLLFLVFKHTPSFFILDLGIDILNGVNAR